ncbi:MAG: hypothetical protein KJ964_12775 [Verrucomicrobia bacterium]|nr:hypothetical protein [Verrucomicrobiota bacterium]MBU1735951.1 hypothetical protein [Verrucomicrobiota bacterium]MBU1855615.1 hypothetical protein [Verrucomicrobiota bacterium]
MKKYHSIINSAIFAAAFGYLEAVVVIYLRTILTRRPDWQTIEISREAATIIMLAGFAIAAGKNAVQRTGAFLLCFGIWDIVYYLGLKIWLNWPDSLMTIDTLFYIPCTWASPVYIPLLFSGLLILLGIMLMVEYGIDHIRRSARWGFYGWLGGCLAGMALAPFIHLPMAVAAMGLAFWCGLITAGMGLTLTITEGLHKVLPLILLSTVIGALSGILAHLARSMFYIRAASASASIGLAALLCLLVAITRHVRRSQLTGKKALTPNG